MAEYKVRLIMSEEYTINADSKEEAEKEARGKCGCDYYIDSVEITELKQHMGLIDKIMQYIKKWHRRIDWRNRTE